MARAYQQSIFGALILWSLDPQGELIAWLDIWLEMFLGGMDPAKAHSGPAQRPRKA